VSIPPRKRLRVEETAVTDGETPEPGGFLAATGNVPPPANGTRAKKNRKEVQFAQADEEGEDDSEDDEDFIPGHVSEGSVDSGSDDEGDDDDDDDDDGGDASSSAASEAAVQPTISAKSRHSPEYEVSESSSSSDTDSSSGFSSDSDTDLQPDIKPKAETGTKSDSNADSDSDSSDSDSTSDSDSDSDSNSSAAPDVLSSKPTVPPWSGSQQTRKRNFRRKQLVKLKQLKAEGKLHPEATYTDLQEYLGTPKQRDSPNRSPAHTMATSKGKRKRLAEDAEDEVMQTPADESVELERRREELMARLADTVPDAEMTPVGSSTTTVEQVEQTVSASASPALTPTSASQKITAVPTPPTKRLRPNVSAIGRILQRQAVNIERKSKSTKPLVVDLPEPKGASEPDFWKSRINLSAFECWDEEHELSAPPFPFEQHWDPASKLMREKKQAKQKKKANKNRPQNELLTNDNEDQNPEDTPILDYDDSPETMKAASDLTDAVESQIQQEVELASKADLPSLPEDIDSLPTLQPHGIQVGAVVAFKVYAIDPVTVTPHISEYKTAIVEKEGDSGHGAGTFRLKLADRDIPHKADQQVDERGGLVRSVVSGFQMDDEEDEEDDSIWEGTFGELVEPKLLKAAD
jgi:hypothetical protein